MHTYFISDLHLSQDNPAIALAFFKFLSKRAVKADALYIIGDLFEYWIGDDAVELLGAEIVIDKLRAISEQVPCYFIAGNRDFLVGQQFSDLTGFTILNDESIIDLYGTPTLILHGDSMCTDDVAHQEFRQQVITNESWRKQFLSVSVPERIEQAKQARAQSNMHKTQISTEIMDVTTSTVIQKFESKKVQQMIHGHTHRQATHKHDTRMGTAIRYVLGDWNTTSSILKASPEGMHIENKTIRLPWFIRLLALCSKILPDKKSRHPL